ncbi:zinc-binding dehydrogenase [Curtobacterium flaccumfaciens]|nr:zinc-binding dehydrogenase [Curtobacterium flaccumfaciens]
MVTAVPDSDVRGTAAEYTTLPSSTLIRRPARLSVVEAAAVWVGFSTAYGALVTVAGLRAGDSVLVTGASGSVGRAAVQIAARLGARAIAITRDPAKTDALRALGAAEVVVSGRDDVPAAVRSLTEGRGADVVLDLVRGPGNERSSRPPEPVGCSSRRASSTPVRRRRRTTTACASSGTAASITSPTRTSSRRWARSSRPGWPTAGCTRPSSTCSTSTTSPTRTDGWSPDVTAAGRSS